MDVFSQQKRSEVMSRVRSRDTTPERAVAGILRRLKVRFRRHVKTLPGSPDFVIRSRKTVIFVHGCFWHRHPNCGRSTLPRSNTEFWTKKLGRNVQRDRRNARLLRQAGWRVIVVWECRLKKPELVSNRLARLLTS